MRMNKSGVFTRHQKIIDLLEAQKVVYIDQLNVSLGVSKITIRRDLEELEHRNIAKRFYGGARYVELPEQQTSPLEEKGKEFFREKTAIAKKAAQLIDDNDIILMNSGSTVLLIPQYIGNKRVSIITNNARMTSAKKCQGTGLIIAGGEYNSYTESLVGELTTYALERVYATKCILGVNGISAETGITTSVYLESEVNNLMLKRCKGKRIIVADGSKVGHSFNFISSSIENIDMLITDSSADLDEIERLKACGVEVIVVSPDDEEQVTN